MIRLSSVVNFVIRLSDLNLGAAMSPVVLLFFFFHFIISLVSLVSAAAPTHIYTYCPNSTFFPSTNTALRSDLGNLLSDLSGAANRSSTPGFHNSTTAAALFYGLYLCRGDDDAATCRECVAAASSELSQNCPLGKQAVTWYDECMIRYSNASFFSQVDTTFGWLMWNTNNITGNVTHFDEVLSAALNNVATKAARGTSALKFATEEDKFDEFRTVYVLGQCTPDLSQSDCYDCLLRSANSMPRGNQQGGRVLYFSCNLRYEIYRFYQQILSEPFSPNHTYCPESDFFSDREAVSYTKTIGALLNNLSSTANTSSTPGFYNTTIVGDSLTLYGLYLCRGDVTGTSTCRDCVAAASTYLPQNCSRGKQAVVLYDWCMIRYSTQYFFGLQDTNATLYKHITPRTVFDLNSSNLGSVGVALGKATEKVTSAATEQGTPNVKFIATDQENIVTTSHTIYMMAQCTPDLSIEDCNRCLQNCSNTLETCCMNEQGAVVYYFSCNIRFEMYQFYSDLTSQSNLTIVTNSTKGAGPDKPSTNTPETNKSKPHTLLITGIVITATVLLLLGLVLVFTFFDRMKVKSAYTADLSDMITVESLQMDFNTIRVATRNFSSDNKLGQGGFGSVYKGELENGQEIAVKRLSENSAQGVAEFKTEVIIVAKLQHRNLVKLLGFCVSGKERVLVYELLPNSSLDKILFDPTRRMSLNWEMRFKIICGIAKGLMYLHEDSRLKVIHRDLKSSNILLDEDLHPKISDFGLAKLFGVDQTQAVTDSIAGTYGYMAPEYILMGHYSIKSDVYSFGIIVLEVISGQRNKYMNRLSIEEALLYRAWKLWNEGEALKLVDETLNGSYAKDDVIKCIHIGLLCIQESVVKRPNMTSVVAALGGQSITLPLPSPPNFFSDNNTSSTNKTTNTSVRSGQDVSIARTSDITELHGR